MPNRAPSPSLAPAPPPTSWQAFALPIAFLLTAVELQKQWDSPARWFQLGATVALGCGWLICASGERGRAELPGWLIDGVILVLLAAALLATAFSNAAGTPLAIALLGWSPLICTWWALRNANDCFSLAWRAAALFLGLILCLAGANTAHIDQLVVAAMVLAAIRAALVARGSFPAGCDGLDTATGVACSRSFEAELAHTAAVANRYQIPFSVIACDIRGTCAKDADSAMMKAFAWMLADCVRNADTVCRWDNRKFTILLPNTRYSAAAEVARKIASAGGALLAKTDPSLTCLCGIGEHRFGDDPMHTLASAEDALTPATPPCPI